MKKNLSYGCFCILASAAMFAACGSDDPVTDPVPTEEYVWSTNGGLKACNCLTFNAEGNPSATGTQIGNGDAEFVFTGKQTLKRGTYVLKGWVYVAEGAELTIEPGTVIKGDKQTKSSLIVERGGRIVAQGTATAPIVFTSGEAAG